MILDSSAIALLLLAEKRDALRRLEGDPPLVSEDDRLRVKAGEMGVEAISVEQLLKRLNARRLKGCEKPQI